MSVRKIALTALAKWEDGAEYINLTVSGVLENCDPSDRAFITAILYGVVERKLTLDYHIAALTKGANLSPLTKNILRMGIYEVVYMHTAPYAAVNETVKLCRHKGEASLVNGILRRIAREPACLTLPPKDKNIFRYLSVAYSIPLPTVRRLHAWLGEDTEAFLKTTLTKAPLTLRINTVKVGVEDYLRLLKEAGISASLSSICDGVIKVEEDIPPKKLLGYDLGYFYVQDPASALTSFVLDPQPNHTVLDICSAPGGKAFGAAIQMQNTGEVHAFDLHSSKLSLIEDGAKRLGLTSLVVKEADGTQPLPQWGGKADRVICDVPCSGMGVLAKKADLRYKPTETMDTLPPLQLRILENASGYVKKGGILVYSTCTVNPEENEGVVRAFLSSHPDFTLTPFAIGELTALDGHITLYPHKHGTDGFYIARLAKR